MTNQLTRREFLKLCGASSVGFMLAACGVASTPTSTPAPTNTFFPTSTALPTATPTLTSTATATRTSPMTATPRVEILPTLDGYSTILSVDFEDGGYGPLANLYDNKFKRAGLDFGITDYPGKGRVYYGIIDLPSRLISQDGFHRLYPAYWFGKFIEGDVYSSVELMIKSGFQPRAVEMGSVNGVFDIGDNDTTDFHVAFTVNPHQFNGKYYLIPNFPGYNGAARSAGQLVEGAAEFTFDEFHKVDAIMTAADRAVRVFQDGKLISKGVLKPETKVGIAGAHYGEYDADTVTKKELYNDNIVIKVKPK